MKDIPRLKRQRLDFVLKHLDRLLLEAQMSVTGRTTRDDVHCPIVPIDDIRSKDLLRYGLTVKHRAALLGNAMVKTSKSPDKTGTKTLKVCSSIVKDGYNEYGEH